MMLGHIRKRDANSYQIQVFRGRHPKTGKPLYHLETVRRDTPDEAKKAARVRLVELLRPLD